MGRRAEQSRGRERGGVMVVFIIFFVITTIGLIFTVVLLNERVKSYQEDRSEAERRIKTATDKNQEITGKIKELIVPVDKKYSGEEIAEKLAELPAEDEKTYRDSIRNKYFMLPENDPKTKDVKEKTELQNTVQENIVEAANKVNVARLHTLESEHQRVVAEDQAKNAKDLQPKVNKILEETIEDINKVIRDISNKSQQIKDQANEVKAKLQEKIGRIEEMSKKEQQEFDEKLAKLNAEEKKLKDEYKAPKNTKGLSFHIEYNIFKVHGKVLRVNAENHFGFIDIGSEKRVVKGMLFAASKPGKRGTYEYKGMVEVKRVWPNESEIEVIATYDKNSPIVEDDLLINPLFDTERPLEIAFLGDAFVGGLARSTDEYKRRLMEIGSTPTVKVGVKTDYVLVIKGLTATEGGATSLEEWKKTDNPQVKEYRRAIELNIPVFTLDPDAPVKLAEILNFLGR